MELNLLERMREMFDKAHDQAADFSEALTVIEPVPPFGGRGAVTVLVTSAALLSVTMLSGVGLVSLAIMLIALAIIFLILTNVFGISFDVDPADIFRHGGSPW
jgi:hypothetical protein